MSQHRTYPPDFKAEVVIESLRGQKSDAQICREREIAADLLARWRQQFLERAPQVFASEQSRSAEQAKIAKLEHLIGRLTVELAAAKKASGLLTSRAGKNGTW